MTAAELFESITNGGMSDFRQVLAVLIGENHPALLHLLPDGLRQQLQEEQSE
jgi:hypothetical protein